MKHIHQLGVIHVFFVKSIIISLWFSNLGYLQDLGKLEVRKHRPGGSMYHDQPRHGFVKQPMQL